LTTSSLKFVPPLIAHRGASNLAPENTLAAFRKAYELGAKWVEFDVMLSSDGEAVVIHDETLDRTTSGHGEVAAVSYQAILKLDAGSWFCPAFANEKVPTLKEVIEFLREHNMTANVEIKAVPGQEAQVVKKVLADIKEHWGSEMHPPLISSFSMPILLQVREQDPDAMIGVLIHEWFDGWQEVCDALACRSVNLNADIITASALQVIKSRDRAVLVYTVNQAGLALKLFDDGVDAVFTDDFGGLLESLPSS
jgi:glycerophosphoryl diester phosphodiesterase